MALADRFASGGFAVASVTRSGGTAPAGGRGGDARPVAGLALAADAGDPAALAAAVDRAAAELGPVRVLLFNVSVPLSGVPSQVDPAAVASALRAGVVGGGAAPPAVLPGMLAAGGGSVLFTGGGTAVRPWVAGAAIGLQKAALRNYALALAEELDGTGVRAGTVRIDGMIGSPGLEPATIADAFWAWHTDADSPVEVVLSPA
jgi:NAD(P)-dependent dehydrogenase (short-subunit alcohol dehydrogenase family)